MDERQDKLQVGAGLQESRLNTDLIQWLEKWGTHILTVVAVIVLGYVGLQKWGDYKDSQRDKAFSAYEAARGTTGGDGVLTGNPGNLLLVADEHDGIASIWQLAKLDAGEIWLGSAWRGLRPGTDINASTPDDVLSDEQIAQYLSDARAQFEQVLARVQGKDSLRTFELRALDGLHAVALSQGDREKAREYLVRLEDRAGDDYARTAGVARIMLANLDSIPDSYEIVHESDLPASATAPFSIDPEVPSDQPTQAPFAVPMNDDGADGGE